MKDIFIRILGFVFIIVAFHRMFLKKDRERELINLGFPKYCDFLIILFELIIGILLLLNVSYKKNVLKLFLLFFIVGCIIIFFRNSKKIIRTYNEIWTFQPNAMSFAMHLYIILIVLMMLYW